jgi:hypothetical protein
MAAASPAGTTKNITAAVTEEAVTMVEGRATVRPPHRLALAVTLLAVLATLAFAASAQASETIEAFRTNSKEQNLQPPPEGLGEIVGTGYALGPPVAGNFEIETPEGAVDTVETTPSTTYQEPSVIRPRLEDVRQGFSVTIYGERTGPQLFASHVIITSPHAGGHPDLSTSFTLADPGEPEVARNITFRAPQGVFGNPNAVSECASSEFALDRCSADSQVGLITVYANYKGNPAELLGTAPIFALEPVEEETALLAFIAPELNIPISIPVTVRTESDYGLNLTVSNITQLVPLAAVNLTIWGFPAIPSHDTERFPKGKPGEPSNCTELANTACIGAPTASSLPPMPLTDNPTSCTGESLETTLEVQTYGDPGHVSKVESDYPQTTGCDLEVFNPVLFASPTTDESDAPSGLNIDLGAPQFLGFAASPSELKKAVVTLPAGFTVNPDAADGQIMCTEAQANFGSEGPSHCPDNAKIGTFSIGTKALNGRLEGAVYIGEPKPGEQYRLFEIASGFGINAKLIGVVRPDPETGRLTVYFEDLPQVPFDDFELHLFASDRGLMATPTQCSVYTTKAVFYPWNTSLAEQESTQVFSLDSGPHKSQCPGQIRPFHPNLVAGTSNPQAGAFSAFALKLDREDGDQFLGKLNFTMPPGLTGNLTGITYCPEASIAAAAQTLGRTEQLAASCPRSSEIGTSNVAAGPGGHPFHAVGRVFLAGPFKGAPLSLVAITPALAGPYDYGTVVVRVALHIDLNDAHVVADSETVPSIIGGIPIRMRSIEVHIDRPNFMINPTNCSPFSVASEGIGDQGTPASFSSPFQAINCFSLAFKPKMTVRQLGGPKATRRSADPGLRFDLTTRAGDANIKSLVVTLPTALEIDQEHLGNICSKTQLEKELCAGRQPIGTVSTETPLLEKPLRGTAYAVSGFGGLPHLAFILAGQVTLIPQVESSTVNGGHLRSVAPIVPDAPIGHFRLTLFGGNRGYLANTRSLCGHPTFIQVQFIGQNGRTRSERSAIKTPCGGHGKHKRAHRGDRRMR